MYEPWVLDIDCTKALEAEKTSKEPLDPDRPLTGKIKPRANKSQRLGLSMIRLVQRRGRCIRETYAKYNADKSPNGIYLPLFSAETS